MIRPWLLLGGLLAALGLAAGAGRWGYVAGRNAEQAASVARVREQTQRAELADQRYAAASADLQALLVRHAELLNRPPPDPKILVKEIPGNAPDCTCADRSDDFWVLYNAAATGADPEGPAPLVP